jgi:hypothetical protein
VRIEYGYGWSMLCSSAECSVWFHPLQSDAAMMCNVVLGDSTTLKSVHVPYHGSLVAHQGSTLMFEAKVSRISDNKK